MSRVVCILLLTSVVATLGCGSDAAFIEELNLDRFDLVFESEKYQLYFQKELMLSEESYSIDELVAMIDAGISRVEGLLGSFDNLIIICFHEVIHNSNIPNDWVISGLSRPVDAGIKLDIRIASSSVSLFSHELLHGRVRELGIRPPRWLSEGMAHYAGTERGFSPLLQQVIEELGILSEEELNEDPILRGEMLSNGEFEYRLRASGWAAVYYLSKSKGWSMREIAETRTYPDPSLIETFVSLAASRASTSKEQRTFIRSSFELCSESRP